MSKEHPNPAGNGKLTSEKITESLEYFAEIRDLYFTKDVIEALPQPKREFKLTIPEEQPGTKKEWAARIFAHLHQDLNGSPEKFTHIAISQNEVTIIYPDETHKGLLSDNQPKENPG